MDNNYNTTDYSSGGTDSNTYNFNLNLGSDTSATQASDQTVQNQDFSGLVNNSNQVNSSNMNQLQDTTGYNSAPSYDMNLLAAAPQDTTPSDSPPPVDAPGYTLGYTPPTASDDKKTPPPQSPGYSPPPNFSTHYHHPSSSASYTLPPQMQQVHPGTLPMVPQATGLSTQHQGISMQHTGTMPQYYNTPMQPQMTGVHMPSGITMPAGVHGMPGSPGTPGTPGTPGSPGQPGLPGQLGMYMPMQPQHTGMGVPQQPGTPVTQMQQQHMGITLQQQPGVAPGHVQPQHTGMMPGMTDMHAGSNFQQQLYARCARGDHDIETKYGPIGIITAILLFPIGLACLHIDMEKRCTRCGARVG